MVAAFHCATLTLWLAVRAPVTVTLREAAVGWMAVTLRVGVPAAADMPYLGAIAAGLDLPNSYFADFRADLESKRDILTSGLREVGLEVVPSQGTYFVMTDVRSLGFDDGMQFCREAAERARVVAIPVAALCADPQIGRTYVRWAFCKQPSVLREATAQLATAFA